MVESYQYIYAQVEKFDWLCIDVRSTTSPAYETEGYLYLELETEDYRYLGKYYQRDTGKWYLDAEFTQEATELNK